MTDLPQPNLAQLRQAIHLAMAQRGYFSQPLEKDLLKAVTAEIGAALDELANKHFIADEKTSFGGEHRLIFLSQVEQLRNHFGIGEVQ